MFLRMAVEYEPRPFLLVQQVAYLTRDLEVVCSIIGRGKLFYGDLSPLTFNACEKSSQWLWKEKGVSTGVGKSGNTSMSH